MTKKRYLPLCYRAHMKEWDKELIALFVEGLNRRFGSKYALQCHPDKENRKQRAVDAIGTVAIEHTRLEAFVGATAYEQGALRELWEPLKRLPLSEHYFWLRVPLRGVVKGQDWQHAGTVVKDWFLRERNNFPLGETSHDIPALWPTLHVTVWKEYIRDFPGMVSIGTYDQTFGDPKQPFFSRVKKAVDEKLPKLNEVGADKRVLLMELLDRSLGNLWDVGKAMKELRPSFSGLYRVEVWGTDNSRWDIPGTPSFCCLHGRKVGECFLARLVVPLIQPSSS
jgi:hypothetical protein